MSSAGVLLRRTGFGLRQNFARVISLGAFQLVSKNAMAALTQSCPQWYKVATQENRKTEILRTIFLIIWPHFLNFGNIKSTVREIACNSMLFCLKILFNSFVYHTVGWPVPL